jgi:hypothetical protein
MHLKILVSVLAVTAVFPLAAGMLYGAPANHSAALPVASASGNATTAPFSGIGWD